MIYKLRFQIFLNMTQQDVEKLANYIRQQMYSGQDIDSIKTYLLSYGYDSKLINDAVSLIAPKKSKKMLLITLALLVIAIITIFSLSKMLFFGSQETEIERKPIGISAEQQFSEKPKPQETIPMTPINRIEKTVERPPEKQIENVQDTTEPAEKTIAEIDSVIETGNEQESLSLCDSLIDEYRKNSCFKKLAIKHNNPDYCQKITSTNLKDNCYFIFAFAGRKDVCQKITDTYQQLTCNSYGKNEELNKL